MSMTRIERRRLGWIVMGLCLFVVVVVVRLIHLQVVLGNDYEARVKRQSTGTVPIPATRGNVFDRNGRVVASSVKVSSLYAYPTSKSELNEVGRFIDRTFGFSSGTAIKKYNLSVRKFRWVRRRLPDALALQIENEAPSGLHLRTETRREYPFGIVGRQILGYTDIDNKGQAGVELSFDSVLSGRIGKADIRRDGKRNLFRVNEHALIKPEPGKSLVLTIDFRMQEMIEQELRSGVETYNAKMGMAVFIDCHSGDILAMAHFDPSEKNRERPVKLRTVTDQFEPGSIFKVFTAAGLLDASLVNFDDTTYCEKGKWKIGRRTLHDDKEREWLKFREIMELSSNIGIAKYAIELGGEQLVETIRKFGIGKKLNVGLPGETRGSVASPGRWSDFNVASLAMGHAVAVTAVQMAAGFGAIANGGEFVVPRLILGDVDDNGRFTRMARTEKPTRAMKKVSSDSLRAMLRGVVVCGTATPVNSEVVTIAGKTGTAQIPDLENRRYFRSKYNSSFAGFFPAENPQIAGIVLIVEPQPVHYGGYTAGPVFARIAERYALANPDLLAESHLMIEQESDRFAGTIEVPDFVGLSIGQAKTVAEEAGLTLRSNSKDGFIRWQLPKPDRIVFDNDVVLVQVTPKFNSSQTMADLKGLSIREVSAFLHEVGVPFRIEGAGRVVTQSIRPGQPIPDKTVCKLKCREL